MLFKRIIFSLSILPIWSFLLLDNAVSNSTTVTFALIYTLLSPHFYKEISGDKMIDKWKILFFIGPIIFLVSVVLLAAKDLTLLFHPIFYAFVAYVIGYNINLSKKLAPKLFFGVGASLFYTLCLYQLFTV